MVAVDAIPGADVLVTAEPGTVLAVLAADCVPIVLYGAGPHTIEEANAHRADERLPLADLFKATEVVARPWARCRAARASRKALPAA